MRFHLLLLLILIGCCTYYAAQTSLMVPAVMGEDGGLVNATLKVHPGSGDVYIGAVPHTAEDTQLSATDAITFAKSLSGNECRDCDFLILFDDDQGNGRIEGPSAGLAMSVMAYSLLKNKSYRDDAVLTGSINQVGELGSVGGLSEKVKAATLAGADYFISPPMGFYQMLSLRKIKEGHSIEVLEASNASEVFGFMFENRTINQSGFRAGELEPPDVPAYPTEGFSGFKEVSRDMLDLLRIKVNSLESGDSESAEVRKYFRNKHNISSYLLDNGYLFTAANSAFLDYIEISTVDAIMGDSIDLEEKRSGAYRCLDSIDRPDMRDGNFQWIIGSKLRESWALDQLADTDIADVMTEEEEYSLYYELMYADAWCHVSSSLASKAGMEGKPINSSIWEELAEDYLEKAREAEHTPDTKDRLEIAEISFEEGRCGAAIFDSVFVERMDESTSDLENLQPEQLSSLVQELSEKERTSLWGQVYQSQGVFLMKVGNNETAYKILRLAEGLDVASAQMLSKTISEEEDEEEDSDISLLHLSIFIIFLLLLIYVAWRKMMKGRSNENKR